MQHTLEPQGTASFANHWIYEFIYPSLNRCSHICHHAPQPLPPKVTSVLSLLFICGTLLYSYRSTLQHPDSEAKHCEAREPQPHLQSNAHGGAHHTFCLFPLLPWYRSLSPVQGYSLKSFISPSSFQIDV